MPVTFFKNLVISKIQKNSPKMKISLSPRRKERKNIASFPTKLYRMLTEVEKDGTQSTVSWNPDGRTLQVHDHEKFVSDILPNYFKQSKYKSFQRQLNFYGFQCINHGPLEGSYGHPLFVRGNKEQTKYIKRLYQQQQPRHKQAAVVDSVKANVDKSALSVMVEEDNKNSRDSFIISDDMTKEFDNFFVSLNRSSFGGEKSSRRASAIGLIKLQDSRRGSIEEGTRLSFSGKHFRFLAADFY